MAKGYSMTSMLVQVGKDGALTKNALFSKGGLDLKIRPSLSYFSHPSTWLLFGHKGLKQQKFVQLSFD